MIMMNMMIIKTLIIIMKTMMISNETLHPKHTHFGKATQATR